MAFLSFRKTLTFLALATGLMVAVPGHSQYSSDIDIYSGPTAVNDAPNVLIVVDNTAN